ncbi:MAG: transcription-repair coupling factor [Planctomycetes bacterium]|nr:transcription-repair coupling factor [Planctomycetota bacterium]
MPVSTKHNSLVAKAMTDAGLKAAAARLAPAKEVEIDGVWGSAAALCAAGISAISGRPLLFIAPHGEDADDFADDLEVLTGARAMVLPPWEVDLGAEHLNDDVTADRLRLCNHLARHGAGPGVIIAAGVMALLQPAPDRRTLESSRLTLKVRMDMSIDRLLQWLVDWGFERVEQVDQQGEFAHRGGIVDILPPGEMAAIRIEFFGDEVDSIRLTDLDSQRSVESVQSVDIVGLKLPEPSGRHASFMSYLPADTIICRTNRREIDELAEQLHRRASETAVGGPLAGGKWLLDPAEAMAVTQNLARLELRQFASGEAKRNLSVGIRSLETLSLNAPEALGELQEFAHTAKVWIYCENQPEREHFRSQLNQTHPFLAQKANLEIGHLNSGFYWPGRKLLAIGHHQIYHRYAKVRKVRAIRSGRPIESLIDLREGDYVVHVAHGIARFEGLKTIERHGAGEEFLSLRFADNAVLHVPASQINLVQKYVGAGRIRPPLSKLGGTLWQRQKERAAEAVEDLAAEMLRVQAFRANSPGFSYPQQTEWQNQFASQFIYTETPDQISAMDQIAQDMFKARPMDRLLCGDVGFGKTELAMRAAFKVVEAGKQVAVLVPTTVLAAQHLNTFRERFADFPVTVDMISRFRTHTQQAQITKRVAQGGIDILIGTHRLLSSDVRFQNLGLVVIDEEQRFGVEHKEKLKHMRAEVDVLTLTATPIPRTLHLALLGLRDISSLSTPPLDRRSIHTEVTHYDDQLIRSIILRELDRKGQVFFVHNRVMDIDVLAQHLRGLVPEARIDVGHGQMPEGELEKVMLKFVERRVDLLLCTTIIESGLDIPTANTIIIHNADRFGLAELHQLRGRVGRYKYRAYCYLLLPQHRPVNSDAAKRLKAVEEFSDLGAGFQIAMRDLEIRGAGNILGREQSGHIAAVGYELYCQLLEQAVNAIKGKKAPARKEVHVELGIEALIPKSYITSERQRMEIYRRVVSCASVDDLKQLRGDMIDAFGQPGETVETMLDMAEVRVRAGAMGIESIVRIDPDIVLKVSNQGRVKRLFETAEGTVRLSDERTIYWRLPVELRMPHVMLRKLLDQLRR